MRVIGLKVENIKGVKAVEITPDPNIVKLSGDNGAGKSTIMDAIAYAIGGKRLIPEHPIRKGQDEAEITVELGDLKITRQFKRSDGGYSTKLKVVAADGRSIRSPQEVLDGLIGELSFDPLDFCNRSDREQYEIMQTLVDLGFDLGEWQAEYQRLYDLRTVAGREVSRLEGVVKSLPFHKDAPKDETAVSAIAAEYQEALRKHALEKKRIDDIAGYRKVESEWADEVARLRKALAEAENSLNTAMERVKACEAIEPIECPDLEEIQFRMDSVESLNVLVRENRRRADADAELQKAKELHKGHESGIAAHQKKKKDAIDGATFPVDGLAFGDNLLLYNGIPVKQASDGEQIKISALIGMAKNPDLRVLFIRKASLISDKNFSVIEELVRDRDYQVWLEYVDTTGEIGIYIEDGMVSDHG